MAYFMEGGVAYSHIEMKHTIVILIKPKRQLSTTSKTYGSDCTFGFKY